MSHFACLVFTEHNPLDDEYYSELEKALGPYDETMPVDPYIEEKAEDLFKPERLSAEYGIDADLSREEAKSLLERDGYKFDEHDNMLSTYNPNSKWDYWCVGGRWENYLKLIDGTRANVAKVSDLRMWQTEQEREDLKQTFERYTTTPGEGAYFQQYYLEQYGDADTYADSLAPHRTRCVITPDGVWHEVGSMWWWGFSSESREDIIEWNKNYEKNFIEPYMDYYVTVVDCHI